MNIKLTFILFLSFAQLSALAFDVSNHYGIDCIEHTVAQEETLCIISEKYFVRPSTLAICNNLNENASIHVGSKLYVPLTETNYYKLEVVGGSNIGFEKLWHTVKVNENTKSILENYYLSMDQLVAWNENVSLDRLNVGDKLMVGFLKHNLKGELQTPRFILEEKIIFGTQKEKSEAIVLLENEDYKKVKPKKIKPTIIDEPTKVKQIIEKKEIALVDKPKKKKWSILSESVEAKGLDENKEVKPATKPIKPFLNNNSLSKGPKKSDSITTKEKEFISKKETIVREKKVPTPKPIKSKIVESSYAREKAKREELIKERMRTQGKLLTQTETKEAKSVVKKISKIEENPVVTQVKENLPIKKKKDLIKNTERIEVNKTGSDRSTPKIVEEPNVKNTESPFIENKLQRLTLLKNTTGKSSFFYSGSAGAKFYVLTNLANKGGIIKILNQANGKFILAEVIDDLPGEDFSKGYILKISDNAKLLLNVTGNTFNAKVFY